MVRVYSVKSSDKLKGAKGIDAKIEILAKDRMEFYADNGVDISYDVSVEEVYSKFCGDTLFGEDSTEALQNILKYEDRMKQAKGVNEQLKAAGQMEWGADVRWTPLPKAETPTEPAGETGAMNNIRDRVNEIVLNEVIFVSQHWKTYGTVIFARSKNLLMTMLNIRICFALWETTGKSLKSNFP